MYLIGNGALNWGPSVVRRRTSAMVGADRTSASTVRRVGLEGRASDAEVAA